MRIYQHPASSAQLLNNIEWRISTACRLEQTPPITIDLPDQPLVRAAKRYAFVLSNGGDTTRAAAEYEAALNQFRADFINKMRHLAHPQPKDHDFERNDS